MLRQSGVLPYRFQSGRLEVLLVTSRTRRRWIIPKGHVEPGLSAAASAAKEAYEEAGVRGRVRLVPLGTYEHDRAPSPSCVEVYVMEVLEELPGWPEATGRKRRWLPPSAAAAAVLEPGLRHLIQVFDEEWS